MQSLLRGNTVARMSSGETGGIEQTVKIEFERGQASAADLQAVVDEVLEELRNPESAAVARARNAGLDPAAVAKAHVSVKEEGEGFEPVLTAIVVGITIKVGAHIAERVIDKVWDDVIWPDVQRRLGGLAVGDKKPS